MTKSKPKKTNLPEPTGDDFSQLREWEARAGAAAAKVSREAFRLAAAEMPERAEHEGIKAAAALMKLSVEQYSEFREETRRRSAGGATPPPPYVPPSMPHAPSAPGALSAEEAHYARAFRLDPSQVFAHREQIRARDAGVDPGEQRGRALGLTADDVRGAKFAGVSLEKFAAMKQELEANDGHLALGGGTR